MIPRHGPPFGIGRVVLEMLNCSKTADVEHIENKFAETFKVPYALLLPSARAGISWALKTAIEPGAKVICPVYTSEVVHEAVIRAGAQLRLIDTQENGFLMEQAALSSAQTGNQPVVLCEIYGYTYNLSALEQNTQSTPHIRIVDMAMTVPGLQLIERLRENNVGFLSFGIAKCMYSGWGGMCFTRNMALAGEIRKIRDLSLTPNNLLFSLKRSLKILLRTLSHGRILYGLLRKVKDIKVRVKSRNQYEKKGNCMLRWQKGEALSPEWFAPSTRLDRSLIYYNLAHVEYYWKQRISLAARYHDNLKGSADIILPPVSPFPLSHYTIRVNSKIRLQLRKYLYRHGIDTGASFVVPQYLCRDDYPNAAAIASEVLNLPLSPYLTFNDIDYISENLIRGVSKLNK